jgi:flagellar hook-basal body complex protein FliE
MSVSGIESVAGPGGLNALAGTPTGSPAGVLADPANAFAAQGPSGATGPTGPSFADLVTNGVEGLEAMNDRTDRLAVGAATGDLGAIHDYTIAATETSVATQLTVAVRNKAVEAFNEIMRMQV